MSKYLLWWKCVSTRFLFSPVTLYVHVLPASDLSFLVLSVLYFMISYSSEATEQKLTRKENVV